MNAGWNYRREHLRLQQRSHYVITDGGDQPNVVPSRATVWYFFRETEYPRIKEMWEIGDKMAQGASLMTGTTWTSRIVGTAWPQHFSKPVAEAMFTNIQRVGLPKWSDDDQAFAKAVQKEIGSPTQNGLDVELAKLDEPVKDEDKRGGGSDDIGDVSWTVPTVTLRYPSNIPGLPGHNWANAIAMATPIAHKGVVAGAKVQAMTMIDIVLRPELVEERVGVLHERAVEGHEVHAVHRCRHASADVDEQGHDGAVPPELKKFYYDPARYPTYLEQLGVTYPMLRRAGSQYKAPITSHKAQKTKAQRRVQVPLFRERIGRSWNRAAFGRFVVPPSRWNIVRVPEVDHDPLPFQPAPGLSMRPSTFFGKKPLGYGMRSVTNEPFTNARIESLRLPITIGTSRPMPNVSNQSTQV